MAKAIQRQDKKNREILKINRKLKRSSAFLQTKTGIRGSSSPKEADFRHE
jgi:hypothetical protein